MGAYETTDGCSLGYLFIRDSHVKCVNILMLLKTVDTFFCAIADSVDVKYVVCVMAYLCSKHLYIYTHVYEVCLKSNRTGVTNNLFHFQTTNYMVSPSK